MQGNIYGLLVKTIKKKFQKSPFRPAGWVLTFDKHQLICSSSCQVFEWTLVELPFTLQRDREFVMFRFYLPLFKKLFMVLLCVLFKSDGYLHVAFWVALSTPAWAMFTELDWKQTAQRLKLQKRLLTMNKRNIIRWNIHRDNNFHSRLRFKVSLNLLSLQA